MKYTNKYNLPEHICGWLAVDEYDYDPATISATTLIGPARAWVIKKAHAEELTMDYSDLLAARYGTAIHDSLERVGVYADGDFREKRFYAEALGFTISGKMDAVIGGVIRDNKSTSVWKFIKQDFDDYIAQLSIYKWLLHKNGIETADHAFIDFFFTDWKRSDVVKGGGYPPIRYQEQRIELWDVQKTSEYIADRLAEFVFAEQSLPDCSPAELWMRDECWAILPKEGAKRASKLCKSAEEAELYVKQSGGIIEHRPGKAVRCGYCTAAPFCAQYRVLKEKGLIAE